ncbi:MAG: 23S rRNA (guanosine(2251)-2'-O)-methyltransferase RlmB [Clostridia bacterium]|nr:23S rRNA (guanosine(2251)-2'-O)-methyltransferase RlmB [Clostridia bacterium]
MLVEGKNPVRELVEGGATINKLFVQNNLRDNQSNQIIQRAKERKLRIDFVTKDFLDKKSVSKRHQGFICDTVEFAYSDIDEILDYAAAKEESPFLVILDSIEDPHNLGAIIRTCECAGVHGIIIPKHRACQVNETVIRTSAGATSNMKIASVTNLNQTIEVLKQKGVWVYGLELGGKDIYKTNLTGSIALVVGSEGFGLSRLVKENCDEIVTLPQRGQINSLNASVACGIAVYEILKQR